MRPAWEFGIAKGSSAQEEDAGGGLSSPVSDHDALSGLLSRSGFNERVRTLIDSHPDEPYMLVYGDIDRFKVYNDLFGTPAGDRLLADIGTMIRDLMPAGAAAARLRADHFVCCCPRSSFDPDRMLAALDAWFTSYREDFTFFVRLGIFPIDDPSLDVNLMCDRALLALRSAKSGYVGSKYVFYDEKLRSSVLKEQELAGEMIAALEGGQFVPYFQPQYRYATGRMIGAEVLARWNHPAKGLLGPLEFIPVFERNGLIATFDYYIWDQACRCLRAWIDERGVDDVPRLSVNLSRADIYRSDLCTYLEGLVERYDVPAELLHLEITESAYMEAPEQLIGVVTKLRAAGFVVEMDDFGSGYSSLNTLKDVPVDVLKLDMGFLDARDSSRGGLILASVVRMARWLDLPIIAEGVETQQQAAYLASVGCEYMQGYLFSRPVDRDTFERLLGEERVGKMVPPFTESLQDGAAEFWNADSQLALIFNSYVGPAAIAEYDGRVFEFVRINRELARVLEIVEDDGAADRVRKNLLALLSEEDRASLEGALQEVDAGADDAACELRFRTDGGTVRWLRLRLRLLSRTGDVSSLYVMAEEATEEQALRDRLVATRDSIPGGYSFYELGGDALRLLDFNDAMAEMVGCTRDEFARMADDDALGIVHEADRWIIQAAIDELRSGAQRASCTSRLTVRDGFLWAHTSLSAVYRSEESLYVVAVVIDVTREREGEQRLRQRNEAQQRLYDAIPCGIVRYTADDGQHIVSINKKGCELLGYPDMGSFVAASGDHALMPIHEDDIPRHNAVVEQLNNGSLPLDFSYRYYRRDGSVGWLEGTSALEAGLDDEPVIQSAFLDVTAQRLKSRELDLQRYAKVLCSVYGEILELDGERETCRLLYSSAHPADGRAHPLREALDRWMSHVPDAQDRASLRLAIRQCWDDRHGKPAACTYRMEDNGTVTWCQTTFLRVSETSVLCCNKDVTERLSEQDRKILQHVSSTIGMLPVGVGVFALRGREVYALHANDLLCAMFGIEPQWFAQKVGEGKPLPVSEDAAALGERIDQEARRKGLDEVLHTKRADGTPVDVRLQGRFVENEGGDTLLYLVLADITDELRIRHERAWQSERYRLLSEMTRAISFDYDSETDTVLLYIDRTGNGMEEQVIPHYLETLSETRDGVVHPDSIEGVRNMFVSVRAGATKVGVEYRADYYGRGYAWYRANLFVVHDDAGAWHLVGLIENIEGERDLRYRAEYDATTGLSNHAATQDLITAALASPAVREHSVCVVLDIDDFKAVNDTAGHMEGDVLLHAVGAVLRANFRESDVIGRVGGDEFVLLLKEVDLDVVLRKLEQVRAQISATTVPGLDRAPSISAGVYATCPDDRAYRDVFVHADEALYQAKRAGKNRVQVYGA